MKHRILLEFSADTLPDDFLDQIAGRVYGHPEVDKKECSAAFVGDLLKDAERYQFIKQKSRSDLYDLGVDFNWYEPTKDLDVLVDAAKDTQ